MQSHDSEYAEAGGYGPPRARPGDAGREVTPIQRAARVVAAAKLLADAARAEGNAARELLGGQMAATGAERVRVSDDAGTNLGSVSRVPGRTTARVVDEAAFAAWVADRHPDQMRYTVAAGFRERLLSAAAALGDPVDADTGELVPGVVVETGEPYLAVRPSADARDRMRTLLAGTGLLALDAGED